MGRSGREAVGLNCQNGALPFIIGLLWLNDL